MKVKEQNIYLAIAGFFQLVFMATSATAVAEMFNANGRTLLAVLSSCAASGSAIIVLTIYVFVLNAIEQRKK